MCVCVGGGGGYMRCDIADCVAKCPPQHASLLMLSISDFSGPGCHDVVEVLRTEP